MGNCLFINSLFRSGPLYHSLHDYVLSFKRPSRKNSQPITNVSFAIILINMEDSIIEIYLRLSTMKTSILLVEDNHKFARLLELSLQDADYEVKHESRGDRAVYRITREQPDLVILDIMLPGMNGDQICHTVRESYSGKILMLTAINDITKEVSSLNLGADDYLTKPVSEPLLLARIEALMRRPSLINDISQYEFGDLMILLNNQKVFLNNQEQSISSSDFSVLALLVKNHDRVLSRNTITFALYGREYDGVDRNIDLKISRLRKLLASAPKLPCQLKTIHGKGYVFATDKQD